MSLTAIRSLEFTRKKFFMNPTQNMCKNLKSNVFGLSLTAICSLDSARESRKREFFMNSTYIMSRK